MSPLSPHREYAPMGGLVKFNDLSIKLAYGDTAAPIAEKRVAAVQALSGTGACRLFAEFQKRFHPNSEVWRGRRGFWIRNLRNLVHIIDKELCVDVYVCMRTLMCECMHMSKWLCIHHIMRVHKIMCV